MKTCPNRHSVHDHLEYCEECGSRVESTPTRLFQPAPPPPPQQQVQLWTCSHCHTQQGLSRYCEACGEPNPRHPEYADEPTDEIEQQYRAPEPPPPPPMATARITVTATADRAFFDRMQSHDGPDAGTLMFPAVYPPRTFTLERPQIFIGRRSRSRGIEPDIDLSGAPEDSGVSHAHAAIINAEGRWCVVDVGSSNGTYLNMAPEPIPANTPTLLNHGDRIHLGAWTTLTVSFG
ncbi:FHA domain-containing protein [Stackebrandtia nassauensis]|uniref:FHA domain containing protein n=1 Tax=Stackebrandtia nassauensis (strain DSM 44728 / CIP 108903 / NRRL B-16338 / NBRC 102104 / LLR-40K-21) TaxID=446470 RepID=D3Q6F9_STANL|nr:FHA domain-containing protein [Stackebrandtia nassauensis]ADD44202.1 FHA domain containing protein [Stackebrandtia nassauensis DSM 44728]